MASPDIKDLNPVLKSKLAGARAAMDSAGIDYTVTSGKRSRAKQEYLYTHRESHPGTPAARPGHSAHETGNAVDIVIKPSQREQGLSILQKYGIVRPYSNDPVHFELAHGTGGGSPAARAGGPAGSPARRTGPPASAKGTLDWNDPDQVASFHRRLGLPVEKIAGMRQEEDTSSKTPSSVATGQATPNPTSRPSLALSLPLVATSQSEPQSQSQEAPKPADKTPSAPPPPSPTPQAQTQEPDLISSMGLIPQVFGSSSTPTTNPQSSSVINTSDPLTQRTQEIASTAVGPLKQAISDYAAKTGGRNYVKDLVIRYAAAPPQARNAVLQEASAYGLSGIVQSLGSQMSISSTPSPITTGPQGLQPGLSVS